MIRAKLTQMTLWFDIKSKRYTSSSLSYADRFVKERENSLQNIELYPHFESESESESESNLQSAYGRVDSIRISGKKLLFIDLKRNSKVLQVILNAKQIPIQKLFDIKSQIKIGDIYQFNGNFGISNNGIKSFIACDGKLLAPCLKQIPLQLKDVSTRHKFPVLNMLVNDHVETIKLRAKIIKKIRDILNNQNFIEVETPILNKIAGGAIAKPFKTHLDVSKSDVYLRIAPELYLKQLIIGGLDKVYEIGKQFRNEGIDSSHNPEFTTCELYQTYTTLQDHIQFTQSFFREIILESKNSLKISINDKIIDFEPEFKKFYVQKELQDYFQISLPDLNSNHSIPLLINLAEKHSIPLKQKTLPKILDCFIEHIIEPKCIQPSFIIGHPSSMSPLSKSKMGISERFELFINGKELVNAYVELNDPKIQLQRFKNQINDYQLGDKEQLREIDYEFLNSLEYGLPPTVGWGLGIDRLCMLIKGTTRIRDINRTLIRSSAA